MTSASYHIGWVARQDMDDHGHSPAWPLYVVLSTSDRPRKVLPMPPLNASVTTSASSAMTNATESLSVID